VTPLRPGWLDCFSQSAGRRDIRDVIGFDEYRTAVADSFAVAARTPV